MWLPSGYLRKLYIVLICYGLYTFFQKLKIIESIIYYIPLSLLMMLSNCKLRFFSDIIICCFDIKFFYSSHAYFAYPTYNIDTFYFFNDIMRADFVYNPMVIDIGVGTDNIFFRNNKWVTLKVVPEEGFDDFFWFTTKWSFWVPFFYWFYEDQRTEFEMYENWADVLTELGPDLLQIYE